MGKSLKKNALFSFLNSFMSLAFPLITFPYASRILLPEGMGKVSFATGIIGFFSILSQLGIKNYAIREASKIKDDKAKFSKFAKEIITINIISLTVSYILFLTCLIFIPKLYEYRMLLLILSSELFLITFGFDWLYFTFEEFSFYTVLSVIFHSAALVFLFIFVKSPADINNYAVFTILNSTGFYIITIFYSVKFIDYKMKCNLELKKHMKFIFTFFGTAFITTVYTTLDSTMLGFLSDNIQVGYYTAGTKLNRMIVGLLNSTLAVLLPRLSYLLKNEQTDQFNALVKKSINIVIVLAIPICVGLIALAKPCILIFCGDDYLPSITPMNILSPIIIAMSLSSLMGNQVLPAIHKEVISLISYGSGAIINVILNFIFIPRFGAIGASLGTLFAEFSVAVIQLAYLRKLMITKDFIVSFIEAVSGSALMYICIRVILNYIQNSFLQIIVSFAAGVTVYFIVMLCCKNKYFIEPVYGLKKKILKQN